jgi:hypothetical protein
MGLSDSCSADVAAFLFALELADSRKDMPAASRIPVVVNMISRGALGSFVGQSAKLSVISRMVSPQSSRKRSSFGIPHLRFPAVYA